MFIVLFIFLYLNSAFKQHQIAQLECTDQIIEEIMISKVLFSPCFVYYDTALQNYVPGTIDESKFTQENYDDCFEFITKKVNLSIQGKTIGEGIHSPHIINKTIYFYSSGNNIPTNIQFTFEEISC